MKQLTAAQLRELRGIRALHNDHRFFIDEMRAEARAFGLTARD